ncbi:MAG: hypothetical protein Q8Q10_05040 [bacterium]|jgi:hypothetical protein|nr:hypothetical protein [bacterium]
MESLKKIITGNLIVALVSFAGSFCLYPMATQAASADMEANISQNASDVSGGCLSDPSDEMSNVATCISDCVTKAPQAVVSKKTSVDSGISVVAIASQTVLESQSRELFSDPFDVTGTHPSSPDILSSVVKRE